MITQKTLAPFLNITVILLLSRQETISMVTQNALKCNFSTLNFKIFPGGGPLNPRMGGQQHPIIQYLCPQTFWAQTVYCFFFFFFQLCFKWLLMPAQDMRLTTLQGYRTCWRNWLFRYKLPFHYIFVSYQRDVTVI